MYKLKKFKSRYYVKNFFFFQKNMKIVKKIKIKKLLYIHLEGRAKHKNENWLCIEEVMDAIRRNG